MYIESFKKCLENKKILGESQCMPSIPRTHLAKIIYSSMNLKNTQETSKHAKDDGHFHVFSWERTEESLTPKARKKCCIEISICEAHLNEKGANFGTKYYNDILPTRYNPVARYSAVNPEELPQLSIFTWLGGRSSGPNFKSIQHMKMEDIMSYILKNMTDITPYIN